MYLQQRQMLLLRFHLCYQIHSSVKILSVKIKNMREILTVQVGQCGNQIGTKLWEEICQEHGVTPVGYFEGETYQLAGIATHFSETPGRRFVPRAILVDLDPMTLDTCRCSPYGQVFRPDNFVFGRSGAENNWAKGHNTDGADLLDYTMEVLRRESEDCESLSGFTILHALAGGSGSGLASLLLERLVEDYTDKIITTYSVFPSDKVSETTVEPYNTVLSFPALIENCNMTNCLDNEALLGICQNILKLDLPTYEDVNEIISKIITGMTCCMRFPGTTNSSLRKINYNMVPYPDAHFFIPGFAPLNSRGVQAYRTFSLENIMQQIFYRETLMSSINPKIGKFITTETVLRGQFSEFVLEDLLVELQRSNKSNFVPWLDYHCSYGVCSIPPLGMKISATFLANHTCITRMWDKLRTSYRKMFNRKAFVQWYYGEGLTADDFAEADEKLSNLIEKYEFLEKLPGFGGCVTEFGDEDIGCDQPVCNEEITSCGLDSIFCDGEMGPICVDRRLFCGCRNGYCSCTDNLRVTYRLDPKNKETEKPHLPPFC